jgi:hypothetical protein
MTLFCGDQNRGKNHPFFDSIEFSTQKSSKPKLVFSKAKNYGDVNGIGLTMTL